MDIQFLNTITYKIRGGVSKFKRRKLVASYQARNHVTKCTMITSNCIGGILSHDLNLRFDSPTINCWFEAEDFVKFVENLEYYLNIPLINVEFSSTYNCPTGQLSDVKIYFQHYKTREDCIIKWEERKKRVDFTDLVVIATDRDGMNKELLNRFLAIPYKKIVYVSHKEMVLSKECIYVPGFESETQCPDMSSWADWSGHRYFDKYFDIVGWLNNIF